MSSSKLVAIVFVVAMFFAVSCSQKDQNAGSAGKQSDTQQSAQPQQNPPAAGSESQPGSTTQSAPGTTQSEPAQPGGTAAQPGTTSGQQGTQESNPAQAPQAGQTQQEQPQGGTTQK